MIPGHCCILLAEDDEILRYVMCRYLVGQGFFVIEANDGPSALRCEAEYDGEIDVLVTNVNMPGFDGHVLAKKLKDKRPNIRVLIVSAQDERDFPPDAKSHNFALLKPVTPERLVTKLSELLDQQFL